MVRYLASSSSLARMVSRGDMPMADPSGEAYSELVEMPAPLMLAYVRLVRTLRLFRKLRVADESNTLKPMFWR